MSNANWFRRLVRRVKNALGICPQDGCWHIAAGNHVGVCDACWNGLTNPPKPTPGTAEYDDETELMQEAADTMRNLPMVSPNTKPSNAGE